MSNNKYTLQSYPFANFAFVGASPSSGDAVKARGDEYQWVIKQTETNGVYL